MYHSFPTVRQTYDTSSWLKPLQSGLLQPRRMSVHPHHESRPRLSGNPGLPSAQVSTAGCDLHNGHRALRCLFRDTVLTQFHHLQSEAFLHQAKFLVRTEKHRLTVFQINCIAFTVFLLATALCVPSLKMTQFCNTSTTDVPL